tara:strand:- start:134 stop:406 length:273 start_codon:yes stop_codon:yes gene_type:complete
MKECNKQFKKKTLASSFIYGGLGYGKVCVSNKISDMLMIIAFPPLFVFFHQKKRKKYDFIQLLTSIFLTSLFYFPGFIHALSIMKTKKKH